jgi:hypothetical protein
VQVRSTSIRTVLSGPHRGNDLSIAAAATTTTRQPAGCAFRDGTNVSIKAVGDLGWRHRRVRELLLFPRTNRLATSDKIEESDDEENALALALALHSLVRTQGRAKRSLLFLGFRGRDTSFDDRISICAKGRKKRR